MSYFLPHIAAMEGYVPGEQPDEGGFVKLNTNENPYPPSPRVIEQLRATDLDALRLYPDPEATGVRRRLASLFGVDVDQTMIGNGSDELLSIILRCFAGRGDAVAYPVPTYSYYKKLIHIQGATEATVPFGPEFELPPLLADTGARLILLANPNSPSGTLIPMAAIESLATIHPGIVVVDEAYVDFAATGCIELLEHCPNVIVLRTMSKSFSLAGMRLGFALAAAELITGMWKVKDNYNVNRLGLVAAEAAIDDIGWMRENARRICATRDELSATLQRLGFHVWKSSANFVFARVPKTAALSARSIYEELKRRRVLVRYFNQPGLDDCLRISVGTDKEIGTLFAQLEPLLTG